MMNTGVVRLIFALHNHQPVGNFDGVFEAAYRDSYEPFLGVMEDYPDIPFVLHTSGPLMEWLAERRPEYVARVRALVESGQVEILGGPFFEPILTMIPRRDRVGQIRSHSDFLNEIFGRRPRGAWIPERVWEQHLVSSLSEAGVEYTVLDDFHFERAGLSPGQLHGYYLAEDEGRLIKIFPGSEPLRYMIPFWDPHASYEFLRKLAEERPGATAVCADDGEKFGSWPQTYDHVFKQNWLRRFCDMIRGSLSWLKPTTFGEAVDATLPLGKIYLPDGSYREMTEWALPPARLVELKDALRRAENQPEAEALRPFARQGGFWRNFKTRYPETDEMYARMLGLSQRLASLETGRAEADPDYLEAARDELYRGQCNCPYWHGSFGGLYLPHLRNAIYHHLIGAQIAIDEAEGKTGPRVALEVGDFNLDARQEVRVENDHFVAFLRPAEGGHLYEFDALESRTNLLNTLDRRPEAYHAAIAAADGAEDMENGKAPAFIPENLVLKQEGLGGRLVYDRHPRKSLVDHFIPLDVSLEDLSSCRDVERGDFVTGAYLYSVRRGPDRVALLMERAGRADGHMIRARKSIEAVAGSPTLTIVYVLEELPEGVPVHFGVEFNIAAMAGHAEDRYYANTARSKLGMLDSRLDLSGQDGLSLTDDWLDLSVWLDWSRPAGVFAFPIETVSQSEGGFEGVYQSSAVIPHWIVTAGASRQWEVRLLLTIGRARGPRSESSEAARTQLLQASMSS